MIIEFIHPESGKNAILLHIDIRSDQRNHTDEIFKRLKAEYPEYIVLHIPNGKPCPNNPNPKIAYANKDNKELLTALKELFSHGYRPGEVKLISEESMKAIANAQAIGDLVYF